MCHCSECQGDLWVPLVWNWNWERGQKMDTGHYWQMMLCYVRIYYIHAIRVEGFGKSIGLSFPYLSSSVAQSSSDSEAVSASDLAMTQPENLYSNQHSQLLFWGYRARERRSILWGLKGASHRANVHDYGLCWASAELQILSDRGAVFFIWCMFMICRVLYSAKPRSNDGSGSQGSDTKGYFKNFICIFLVSEFG